MKTLTVIFSFAIILFSTNLSAQSFSGGDKTPFIFETIQNNIHVPTSMKENVSTERVRVVFSIDENGKTKVLDINTNREDLKASVIKQFEALDLKEGFETPTQTYSIWLNFKVL